MWYNGLVHMNELKLPKLDVIQWLGTYERAHHNSNHKVYINNSFNHKQVSTLKYNLIELLQMFENYFKLV